MWGSLGLCSIASSLSPSLRLPRPMGSASATAAHPPLCPCRSSLSLARYLWCRHTNLPKLAICPLMSHIGLYFIQKSFRSAQSPKVKPNVTEPQTCRLPCPQPTTLFLFRKVISHEDVWVPPQGPGLKWSGQDPVGGLEPQPVGPLCSDQAGLFTSP